MQYIIKKLKLLSFAFHRLLKFGIADAFHTLLHRDIGYEAMKWKELIPNECNTIIDVGAHVGSVSAVLNFLYRPNRLIAVEPNPDILLELNKRFGNYKNVEVIEQALSSTVGKSTFNIHRFEAASSIFKVRAGFLKNLGFDEEFKTIEVACTTLDEIILSRRLKSVSLLKLDCQGAELDILHGATQTLHMINIIHTEVLFEDIYKDVAKFSEIHNFLINRGFELRRLHSFCGLGSSIQWADAVYFNTSF